MTIKIPGINFTEGGDNVALIYDSTITIANTSNWTVPSGKVFKGYICSTANNSGIRINSSFDFTVGVFSSELGSVTSFYEFGGGTNLQHISGNQFKVQGTLYVNG